MSRFALILLRYLILEPSLIIRFKKEIFKVYLNSSMYLMIHKDHKAFFKGLIIAPYKLQGQITLDVKYFLSTL